MATFMRGAWPVLEPTRELVWSWHYDMLCEYLSLIRDGLFRTHFEGVQGLIVNVPPRSAKSSFISVGFPVWCWLTKPSSRFLCASYSASLSSDHSVFRRNIIQSEWFQENWGGRFKLAGDQNVKTHFDNDKTGQMIATSVGGSATGKGGDIVIIDDPLKPDEASSDTERKNANDWFDNTVRSRLNDPKSGVIIIVMQRLHEMDLTGYVLDQDPRKWIHLVLPLEAEVDERWEFPLSGTVIKRKAGEILLQQRYSDSDIAINKKKRSVWASQYQQRPSPIEGNIIRYSEIQFYGGRDPVTGEADAPLPDKFDEIMISADCAFKDLKTSDYVAIGAIGIKGPKRYILNVINKHLDAPATESAIDAESKRFRSSRILVEDKANGSAIIKQLKRKCSGVVAIEPQGGKFPRMMAAAGEWQAGDWYVDRNAAWTGPFIDQITKFPNAANDDMADMMSQVAVYLQQRPGTMGVVEWLKREQAILDGQRPGARHQDEVVSERQEQTAMQHSPADKLANSSLVKPATNANTKECPQCHGIAIRKMFQGWRCNKCGHQWGFSFTPPEGQSRKGIF